MARWTLDQIELQAVRGGVNRQQADQLVGRVRQLEQAIRDHRAMVIHHDGDADDLLWAYLGESTDDC